MLVVDAAHGAHLPFLGNNQPVSAADLLVVVGPQDPPRPGPGGPAALRQLPSLYRELRRAASLYGSSSPSYPIMASLDAARAWMEEEGGAALGRTAEEVAALRRRFPSLDGAALPLDPCRLTVRTGDGFGLQAALQAEGIYPEMADRGHVVFICTAADNPEDFAALGEALERLLPQFPGPEGIPPPFPAGARGGAYPPAGPLCPPGDDPPGGGGGQDRRRADRSLPAGDPGGRPRRTADEKNCRIFSGNRL